MTVLANLDTQHIFGTRPTYQSLARLPRRERARRMAEPDVRAAILAERDSEIATSDPLQLFAVTMSRRLKAVFPYEGLDTDYEPSPQRSVQALAEATGRTPEEVFYDLLIADEGEAILIWFADRSDRSLR